jgi:hypothetical protein
MESNTNSIAPPQPSEAKIFSVGHLLAYLMRLTDSRERRGLRYRLEIVLSLFILAKLCGQNKPYGIADWVHQRQACLVSVLKLERKTLPHHSAYRRICERCDRPCSV